MQRYAVVGQESPRQDLNVRYVIGDPSTTIYWTSDRPNVEGLDLSNCPNANVWRYGFDQFNGTAQGLKTPQNYFAQYIKRQVVFMVGYQDTSDDGDQSCEAQAQVSAGFCILSRAENFKLILFSSCYSFLLVLQSGRSIPKRSKPSLLENLDQSFSSSLRKRRRRFPWGSS